MKLLFCAALLALSLSLQASDKLVAGPMLGYVEHLEALIWVEVSAEAETVDLVYRKRGSQELMKLRYAGALGQTYNPIKFVLTDLEMNTQYDYEIWIDGVKESIDFELTFKTRELWQWRKDAPDFSFIIGSCSYVNDEPTDRPGTPYGKDPRIFESITKQPSDFMIWMGDNWYYREVDWSSVSGLRYRASRDRRQPVVQELLSSRAHFAVWDDHDFGPNDSDLSYELKEDALKIFQDYWGNKTYGEWDNPGVYGKFTWGDADFFMLDNRFHRANNRIDDDSDKKPFLGGKQLEWLKNALLSSRARFKFIVCGNQVLNQGNRHESYPKYRQEHAELMNFIRAEDIWGVVFLSGDRHFTEVIRDTRTSRYTLYDITSSPLTANPYTKVAESDEGQNPDRVPNTLFAEQSYVKISILGDRQNRHLLVQCFDINNKEQWKMEIDKNDLRPPRR